MSERRVVIVSNRLPVQVRRGSDGLELVRSSGGLVTGMAAVHGSGRSRWVGTLGGGGAALEDKRARDQLEQQGLHVVDVQEQLYTSYYEGFSNRAIWPLFHYMPERCHFGAEEWEAYRRVNELFAEAVLEEVENGDVVWVQDYQLMLVPHILRRRKRSLRIGFFMHIPFPAPEVFRILPWNRDVLLGLLGADLVGFHTLEYTRHFSSSLARVLGLEPSLDHLLYGRRRVAYGAFPLGIDVKGFNSQAREPESERQLQEMRESYRGQRVVLGVDRLDYTKGIPERLRAYAAFLESHPYWHEKVTLIQVSVPSRTNVTEYQRIKAETDQLVGHINGRFGTPGWMPVHYIFRNLDKPHLLALYRLADVMLVTPIRDGLNLVCKEYVAAKGDEPGVMVLSEFAGSAAEMGGALMVNPWSRDLMVETLERALGTPEDEGRSMMSGLYERLVRYDHTSWSREFLSALDAVADQNQRSRFVGVREPEEGELARRVESARRVFLCLDYDGTLVAVAARPAMAVPTPRVLTLLSQMSRTPRLLPAVVSGRDRDFLDRHLPGNVTIIAEHGACMRKAGADRYTSLVDDSAWLDLRDKVLSVMSDFERRIPGSLVEEKEYGLVWHYRMADPIFASQQALGLVDTLGGLLQFTSLGVTIAKKAVEVRHSSVNKGEAVRTLLEGEGFEPGVDMLVTIGDDRTDEDMFKVHPDSNLSIGVGETPVLTTFTVEQPRVVPLLEELLASMQS